MGVTLLGGDVGAGRDRDSGLTLHAKNPALLSENGALVGCGVDPGPALRVRLYVRGAGNVQRPASPECRRGGEWWAVGGALRAARGKRGASGVGGRGRGKGEKRGEIVGGTYRCGVTQGSPLAVSFVSARTATGQAILWFLLSSHGPNHTPSCMSLSAR